MSESAPYRHIVIFKFKPEATAEQIQGSVSDLCALTNEFDGMVGFEHGRNMSPEGLDQGCSHVFLMTFRSQSDFEHYLHHPQHCCQPRTDSGHAIRGGLCAVNGIMIGMKLQFVARSRLEHTIV